MRFRLSVSSTYHVFSDGERVFKSELAAKRKAAQIARDFEYPYPVEVALYRWDDEADRPAAKPFFVRATKATTKGKAR